MDLIKEDESLDIEKLAKQNSILTESEIKNFISYDEAVQYCIQSFNKEIEEIEKQITNNRKVEIRLKNIGKQ